MVRVRFIDDYDYKPVRACTIGYEAGWEGTVKKDCATKAVAAGKAVLLSGRGRQMKKVLPDGNVKISG